MKEDFNIDSGKTQTYAVSCDLSKAIAISGGYEIDNNLTLVASEPAKNGWQVTLTNQTRGKKTVTVYANCLVGFGGKTQTVHVEKTVDGKSFTNIKLGCQTAGSVVSGGFDLSTSPDLFVTESRLVGAEWVITVVNPNRSKQTFDAYAQCLVGSGFPALMARDGTVKIPGSKSQVVETNCDSYSISGGYQAPAGLVVLSSRPTALGWTFEVENTSRRQLIFKPQVLCIGLQIQSDQQGKHP